MSVRPILFSAAAVCLCSAALAFQANQQAGSTKADAKPELPPEIARLPFEIRDGYRVFIRRCTACHDTKRIYEAKKSLFDWQGTIGKMAYKPKSDIPLEERNRIFLYLTYLHGTNAPAAEKEQYLAFLTKCEDCHGVALIYRDRQPLKKWPDIVHRMAGKNRSRIAAEDEKKIMDYINRIHPDLFGID